MTTARRNARPVSARSRRRAALALGTAFAVGVGLLLTSGAASATVLRDTTISVQGFHTSNLTIENNTLDSRLVQTSAKVTTGFEEGGAVATDGTVIRAGASARYEVVTDRTGGNSADISYVLYSRFGNLIGTVDVHLNVPAWGWLNPSYTCQTTGGATCTLMGAPGAQWFMITDGSCPSCWSEAGEDED